VIFYFSGAARGRALDTMLRCRVAKLASFAYPKEAVEYLRAADAAGISCRIIIDSGAFSAWNSGTEVDVKDLVSYINDLCATFGKRHPITAIALDKIPGTKGTAPSEEEFRDSVAVSKNNYLAMKTACRAQVLPVYHYGTDLTVLNWYRKHTRHLCFGALAKVKDTARTRWLGRMSREGLQVHGLGITSETGMRAYPWHSVDSASWALAAAMGHIVINTAHGLRQITISAEAPRLKEAGMHIFNMSDRVQIETMIRERGYDPEELSQQSELRACWNIETFAAYQPRAKTEAYIGELFK
jgi:hypothetical protein